jgi:hypothetical protein
MPPESQDASSTPSPAATVAPAAPVNPSVPTHQVTQHLLSSDGPSTVTLPEGSRLLDVHMIDGRYVLRAVEPIKHDGDDDATEQVQVVPAALGTKLSIVGLLPLVVRSGGIHFFATAYEV